MRKGATLGRVSALCRVWRLQRLSPQARRRKGDRRGAAVPRRPLGSAVKTNRPAMKGPLMFGTASLRRTACLTLFFFFWATLHPSLAAAAQTAQPVSAALAERPEEKNALDELRGLARQARNKARRGGDRRAEEVLLLQSAEGLDAEERRAEAEFAAVGKHLEDRRLPDEIKQRHAQALAEYRAKMRELRQRLRDFRQARSGADAGRRLGELADFLDKEQKGHGRQPFDPKNLPFGTPESKTRAPKERKEELDNLVRPPKPAQVAAGELVPGLLAAADPGPGPAPTPEDLAGTEDAQITQAVKDQAAALHNNPVEIYNWVRNTIEFLPTYGSIQGSDLTLQAKRGNAFDTASLLIALLRAAGVPARYAYGTVQIPAEQAMNWVGGVKTPEAAHSLLAQGGIPVVGVASGGRIAAFKLEHVWVEAFVDYVPSRGAVNKAGDTWVPMDASFKQYQYTPGMDLKAAVPLDAQALLAQVQAGATVNEAEGWAQNLDATALQTAMADYQSRVKSYVDSRNAYATVDEVVGAKTITVQDYPFLMGSLPYQIIATGSQFSALPTNLQWKFRTTILSGGLDYVGDPTGSELVSLNRSTVSLSARKITLSFYPATQADADLLNSYLPKPHADGSPIQPNELPASLPGYLFKLKAELRVDGQAVAQSAVPVSMGSELSQTTAFYNPAKQQWEESGLNRPIAGEYHALALDLQGTGQSQFSDMQAKLEATAAKMAQFKQNPGDPSSIHNLTKEDISGDILYSGILRYFASVDAADQLAARADGQVVQYRLPSYGAFLATVQPRYWFGIARSVSFPGMVMDIDRIHYQLEAKDGDKQKKIAYMRQAGAVMSAFEHAVPEWLLSDRAKPLDDPTQPRGMSATRALFVAAAQGQKLFRLTPDSQSGLGQIGINSEARTDIANALAAGQEVTVHQNPVSQDGWSGTGYIIFDPTTGTGAYRISGGLNGGVIQDDKLGLSFSIDPSSSASAQSLSLALAGGVVDAARKDKDTAKWLARSLARVAPEVAEAIIAAGWVVTLIVAIAALVELVVWISEEAAKEEEIRQTVIDHHKEHPFSWVREWPENNCTNTGERVKRVPPLPGGWKECIYRCATASFMSPRTWPVEWSCPSPVPCVPGYYSLIKIPPDRSVGDPVPLDVYDCMIGG